MKRLSALAVVACFSACDKSGFSYDNVIDGGNVQYSLMDTLQVQMRTVQLDSVRTSGTGTGLVGSYTDPVFGKFTSHTTFRVDLPVNTAPDLRAIYDSLELIIRPDGHYYGIPFPRKGSRYSSSPARCYTLTIITYCGAISSSHAEAPLADVTQYIRPTSGDAVHLEDGRCERDRIV